MIDNKLSLDKEDIVFVEGLQLLYLKSCYIMKTNDRFALK